MFTLIIILALASMAAAQDNQTQAEIVDSLFMRASSGMVMFRDQVEPSKEALIAMGEKAIPQLLTKLDTRSAREMLTLDDIFKGMGEIAVKPLTTKLKSRDEYVRNLAIRCLGDIGSPKAIPALVELVNNDDYRTRGGVMRALGEIGDRAGARYAMQGLSDENELVATSAAVACGKIKTDIDPAMLIEVLGYPYYGVRYSAMQSLIELGDISVEPLVKYSKIHQDDISTGYAIEALGKLGSKKAFNVFKHTLYSDDWAIRAFTAEALGDIDQGKAKGMIKKALKKEEHPLVVNKLKQALEKYEKSK
jgi:HEAT repeat protein